jgi:hypothetical protein
MCTLRSCFSITKYLDAFHSPQKHNEHFVITWKSLEFWFLERPLLELFKEPLFILLRYAVLPLNVRVQLLIGPYPAVHVARRRRWNVFPVCGGGGGDISLFLVRLSHFGLEEHSVFLEGTKAVARLQTLNRFVLNTRGQG